MRIGLMQQIWRANKLFDDMKIYAQSINCEVLPDEIVCNTNEKARRLAKWWTEHTQ
jgi:hypothetical protein